MPAADRLLSRAGLSWHDPRAPCDARGSTEPQGLSYICKYKKTECEGELLPGYTGRATDFETL